MLKGVLSLKDVRTGAAWLSSARIVRRSLKWGNERNPYCLLYVSGKTAQHFAHKRKEILNSKS